MRVSVNINNDIESIVRSYSEIKQCFSSSSTIQQFEYNHVLEYHLHNIEEKLLNIRSEVTAVKAQIDAELSPSKSVDTNNSTPVPAHESVSISYPTAQPTQPYRPTIDVAKYRTDIFSQPSEPEQPEENKPTEKNEDNDFQYYLKYYKQKCAEVNVQGKLLERRLWGALPCTVFCIFLYIFLTSIGARYLPERSTSYKVYHYLIPFIVVFGSLTCVFKYYLWKVWQWYKILKQEKAELEDQLKEQQDKIQESINTEDKKYIDNILQNFDRQFDGIKPGLLKGLWLWLLFNIGNFLMIAAKIRYPDKDNKLLLICIIWLILTTGYFLLPSLMAWVKLKNEKLAFEYSKRTPSASDPEIALLTTDELAEKLDTVCKKRVVFLILIIIFAVVAAITLPGIILLINHGKQLAEHGAIVFYIVIALNYAMGIISFLCFNKYRKEYNRLQRR